MMDVKRVVINVVLAAFWAGLATFAATQAFSKAAGYAAIAAAARAGYAALSANVGPVPQLSVDRA
jgi:hypothetical protein